MFRLATWSWRASSQFKSTLQSPALRMRSANSFYSQLSATGVSYSSLRKSRSVLSTYQRSRRISSYFARDKEGSGYLLAGLATLVGATVTGFVTGQFNPYLGYKDPDKAETAPTNDVDAVGEKDAAVEEESDEDRWAFVGELPDKESPAKAASENPDEAAVAIVLETDKVTVLEGEGSDVADVAPSLTSTDPEPTAESLLIVEDVQTTASLETVNEAIIGVVTEKTLGEAGEPLAESITTVVEEPVSEPVGEQEPEAGTALTHEPVAELAPKHQDEPLTNSVDELTAEASAQLVPEPDDKPAFESSAEPVAEAAAELTVESAAVVSSEPTTILISEPLPEPVIDSPKEAIAELAVEPASVHNDQPVAECIGEPEAESEAATEAVAEPSAEAVAEPSVEAVAEPSAEAIAEPSAEAVAEPAPESVGELVDGITAKQVEGADVHAVSIDGTVVTEQQNAQSEEATPLGEESACSLADVRSEELFNTSPIAAVADALGSTEQVNEASMAELTSVDDEKEAKSAEDSGSVLAQSEELDPEENSSDEKPAA